MVLAASAASAACGAAAGDAAAAGSTAAAVPPAGGNGFAMQMGGAARYGQLLFDQLEWRHDGSSNEGAWEVEGWYGGDRDKVWVRTEGERSGSATENAFGELLAGRAIGPWWNAQLGVRQDFGGGPARTWAALGVEGLAPYWLNLEATLYAGAGGRTAGRLKGEYDLLLTQRLILQPEVELNVYGKRDPARQLGSGIADAEAGLRLRYEIRRELAPYVGLAWTHRKGILPASTAAGTEAAGIERSRIANGVSFVVGIRAWF